MSSLLQVVLLVAGAGTTALGIWHLSVPRFFAFDRALGRDDAALAPLGDVLVGRWRYARRRSDALGLTWVMSNAASFVLVSIGLLDVAWALGDRSIPLALGGAWVAAWWLLRAAGQASLGRRRLDVAFAATFTALASVHAVAAVLG